MAIKFSVSKKKPIVFCIIDNTNNCQTNWAKEISINLTDQFIFKCHERFDILIGESEDLLAKMAVYEEYKYAVFISTGTSLKMNDKLFESVEKLCSTDFSLAGHILDRKEYYYELHHQFYILNLYDYSDIDMPEMGYEQDEYHDQIEPIRSEENVHDDYVPLWIKTGKNKKTYVGKKHGWNLISKLLLKEKKIIDLGDIRNYKKYLYYEHDHVFLKEVADLYYYQFFGSNFVPSHNSDSLLDNINCQGPIEQYITTGTGFNWINNLNILGTTNKTKVVITDVNPQCLQFMSLMISQWSGENYGEFYKSFINKNFPSGPIHIPEEYYIQSNILWEKFKSKFYDWDMTWNRIKNLQYGFILINYLGTYNLDWVDNTANTFYNVSDVFNYTPLSYTSSLKYRIAAENRLIYKLQEKNPEIFLSFSARAADGFCDKSTQVYKDRVCKFNLTDINILNKPKWHSKDWTSPIILR